MMRISTVCLLSGALAASALSARTVSAATLTVHTQTPNVKVQAPKVQINPKAVTSTGTQPSLQFRFKEVYTTQQPWSGGTGNNAPQENVGFVYGAMGVQYQNQTTGSGSRHLKNHH